MSLETLKTKVGLLIEKAQSGGTEEIENIIDQSGVLGTTDETVTVTEKVEQLIDKAEDGNWWYEASKKLTNLSSNSSSPCFVGWDYSRLPKTDFSNIKQMSYAIYNTQLECIDFYINSAKCTNFGDALSTNRKLKWMVGVDLTSATNIFDLLMGNSELETIQEPLNIPNVTKTTAAFDGCNKLKDIRFVPETIKVSIAIQSPVLTLGNIYNLNDTENIGSVQSIINGLAPLEEGAAAQTLTLRHNLPLTAEQKQAITTAVNNKGWTLAFA